MGLKGKGGRGGEELEREERVGGGGRMGDIMQDVYEDEEEELKAEA